MIPSYAPSSWRRTEQKPNWLDLRWHPAPAGQAIKVRLEDGSEIHAIKSYGREWYSCNPQGFDRVKLLGRPTHWLNGFIVN